MSDDKESPVTPASAAAPSSESSSDAGSPPPPSSSSADGQTPATRARSHSTPVSLKRPDSRPVLFVSLLGLVSGAGFGLFAPVTFGWRFGVGLICLALSVVLEFVRTKPAGRDWRAMSWPVIVAGLSSLCMTSAGVSIVCGVLLRGVWDVLCSMLHALGGSGGATVAPVA